MNSSSHRFKSIAVTGGFSFWFYIIIASLGYFKIEYFLLFIGTLLLVTQLFSVRISKGLDIFAKVNTKIFLSILFVTIISLYGILFRFLKIDLLRLKKQKNSYWLDIELNDVRKMF
ncbi:MAG: hypothetical protein CL763_10345 [Chloroflexi bacterium]|nr:hypothetical protein [Chloroflexota bacterium]|tara:strand:+ start:283 stop:630 length:348 start_codon:yes stop_codon:yes gene_type:complete